MRRLERYVTINPMMKRRNESSKQLKNHDLINSTLHNIIKDLNELNNKLKVNSLKEYTQKILGNIKLLKKYLIGDTESNSIDISISNSSTKSKYSIQNLTSDISLKSLTSKSYKLDTKIDEISQLKTEISNYENITKNFLSKETKFSEKIETLKNENFELKNTVDYYKHLIDKNTDEYNETVDKLKSALKYLNEEYNNLCCTLSEFEIDKKKLEERNNNIRKTVKLYKENNYSLKEINQDLSKTISEIVSNKKYLAEELHNTLSKNQKLTKIVQKYNDTKTLK